MHLGMITTTEMWIKMDEREQIECERFYECGDRAAWMTRQGNLHVCETHREIFETMRKNPSQSAVRNLDDELVAA